MKLVSKVLSRMKGGCIPAAGMCAAGRPDPRAGEATAFPEAEGLADLISRLPEGVFRADPKGRLLFGNEALAHLHGYENFAAMARDPTSVITPRFADIRDKSQFYRIIASEGSVTGFDARIKRRSGDTTWARLSAVAVIDAARGDAVVEGVIRDITDRVHYETALRAARANADLANRNKTAFFASVGHEIRTALNNIVGFSELLGDDARKSAPGPRFHEYVANVHASASDVLALIDDVMDVVRIESGELQLEEGIVDVWRVMQEAASLVRARARKSDVQLKVVPSTRPPQIQVDEKRLKQMLVYLLANAVRLTPSGGYVTLHCAEGAENNIRLSVRDNGIGLSVEDTNRALAPFDQIVLNDAPSSGEQSMGLPLVKAIAELHGGRFELESAENEGTVATISLPRERIVTRRAS